MNDQADELRQLVRGRFPHANASIGTLPFVTETRSLPSLRKVVVSAGRRGVGTSTVAVNLATALARHGCRTILVDADLNSAGATWICGLQTVSSIAEVASGRRKLMELLRSGPFGVQVLPGGWSLEMAVRSSLTQQQLLKQLDHLAGDADLAVLDVGCGLNSVVKQFWQAADEVLLVTTVEALSVMEAYAAIKFSLAQMPGATVQTVVTQCRHDAEAAAVQARLTNATSRFLGMTLGQAEIVPWDPAVQLATAERTSLHSSKFESPAAVAIDRLARRMLEANELAENEPHRTAARSIAAFEKIDQRAVA